MHPLRFPNSGIKGKIFVRKIGFKLYVMRLNRVELFYSLVAAMDSESPLQGVAGRPPAGTVDCGQPAGATVNDLPTRASRQRSTRKGLPPVTNPAASRGGDVGHRGGFPLTGPLSAARGNRHLCKGSDDDDVLRVKEG
ncbi:hypothetical protein GW17_00060439 [Ensete ventricosum]|nr:hypothetical protein GW17_00060439 [Ensete ventricosum]